MTKCPSNGEGMIIHLIAELMKKISHKNFLNEILSLQMSQFFPKPFRSFRGSINGKVDVSNNATKTDLTNVTHVDTSTFALKTNLVILKTEVDKLDIEKLAPVPVDLSKLSNAGKMVLLKRLCMIN